MASAAPKPIAPRYVVKKKAAQNYANAIKGREKATRASLEVSTQSVGTSSISSAPTISPPLLQEGQEQLYSYYLPSLGAGLHTINVTQNISRSDNQDKPLEVKATQEFDVIAPRFSLPDGEVRSSYPPQGHADLLNILPHVVLEDPHLPWERPISSTFKTDNARHQIPWLALLVFEQEELQLAQSLLQDDTKIFPSNVKQSPTWSVNMTLNDLKTMQDQKKINTPLAEVLAASPVDPAKGPTQDPSIEGIDSTTMTQSFDFIFMRETTFQAYFRSYNTDGTQTSSQTFADVSRYEYLSHVRNINTTGMRDDATGGDEQGLFSVVVAHRAGDWTITKPAAVVVHLVSLEGVEKLPFQRKSGTRLYAFTSLHSWTYQCLPLDGFNIYDDMDYLASTIGVLSGGPLDTSEQTAKQSTVEQEVTKNVSKRVNDGYTLGRWRTSSGEETLSMWRGPFTPMEVPHKLDIQSTFSTDLQILDPQLGIIDISYSCAWQLGKTMAIADQAFTAAVSRIRSTISGQAWQALKSNALSLDRTNVTKVASNLQQHAQTLVASPLTAPTFDASKKWQNSTTSTAANTGFFSDNIRPSFQTKAVEIAKQLASAIVKPGDPYSFYNEQNKPASTDWAKMMDWLLNRMFFYNMPAHYLITDPDVLPKESLKLFSIDYNWVDAFVDGALSICNHIEGDDDQVRTAIKTVWNEYLQTPDPLIGYAPQVPRSGILLRSALVTKFPDLIINAPWTGSANRASFLRKEIISEDTLLLLFDRVPGDGLLTSVTFRQPPHQQCFACSDVYGRASDTSPYKGKTIFEVNYKQIYTTDDQPSGEEREKPISTQTWIQPDNNLPAVNGEAKYQVFDWNSRCLIFPAYALQQRDILNQYMPTGKFNDTEANSAAVGIQLNEPMYQFDVDTNLPPVPTAMSKNALPNLKPKPASSTSSDKVSGVRPKPPLSTTAADPAVQPQPGTVKMLKPLKRSPKHPSQQGIVAPSIANLAFIARPEQLPKSSRAATTSSTSPAVPSHQDVPSNIAVKAPKSASEAPSQASQGRARVSPSSDLPEGIPLKGSNPAATNSSQASRREPPVSNSSSLPPTANVQPNGATKSSSSTADDPSQANHGKAPVPSTSSLPSPKGEQSGVSTKVPGSTSNVSSPESQNKAPDSTSSTSVRPPPSLPVIKKKIPTTDKTEDKSADKSSTSPPLKAVMTRPLYNISCYPAGYALKSPIPGKTTYPTDLIFGVNFMGSAEDLASECRLKEIVIHIPLGDNTQVHRLTSFYNGDKATMLSNLRWNALLVPSQTSEELLVTLIPRSSTAPPQLSWSQELGFIISEVDLNNYALAQSWTLDAYETYLDSTGKELQPLHNASCSITIQPSLGPPST